MQMTFYPPIGVTSINLSDGSVARVVGGQITADSAFSNELEKAGCVAVAGGAITQPVVADSTSGAILAGGKQVATADFAPRRFVDIGDSRSQQAYLTIAYPTTPPGTSHRAQGASVWANALCGQRMQWMGNFGVGGSKIADVISRLPQLDNVQFDWIVFHCDLNDTPRVASSGDINSVYADVVAGYEQVYLYAKKRGARIIHVGPYAPSTALSAAQSQLLMRLRDYILRAQLRLSHVFAVDSFSLFSTASASPPTSPSSYMLDGGTIGWHYNVAAAQLIGQKIADIWSTYVTPVSTLVASASDFYTVDSTNPNINEFGLMLANGGTLGTAVSAPAAWATATAYSAGVVVTNGGNAYQATNSATSGATAPTHTSGTVSDGAVLWKWLSSVASTGVAVGYTLKRQGTASGTIYAWMAARADGIGQDQCFAVTGAASATTVQFSPTASVHARLNGGVAAGQAAPVTEMEVSIAGASGLQSPMARTLLTTTGGSAPSTYQWRSMNPSTEVVGNVGVDCTLRLKTPDGVLPPDGTITALESHLLLTFDAASAGGFFKVGRHSMRMQ